MPKVQYQHQVERGVQPNPGQQPRRQDYRQCKVSMSSLSFEIRARPRLETVDLDGLGVEGESVVLVAHEVFHILALVALQLNHLAHLRVVDDGAIAGKLLLDDLLVVLALFYVLSCLCVSGVAYLQDLLLVKLLGQALNSGQGLPTIALLDPNVDVRLGLICFPGVFVRVGEGVCERMSQLAVRTRQIWRTRLAVTPEISIDEQTSNQAHQCIKT